MNVRTYERARDRDALSSIYLESRTAAFHWLPSSAFGLDDFERDTEGETILVLETGKQPLAFSSSWVPERFLHHLYVAPTAIGSGCGSLLLNETIRRFGTPFRLKCLSRNGSALAFYRKRGWTVIGRGEADEGAYLELEYSGDG